MNKVEKKIGKQRTFFYKKNHCYYFDFIFSKIKYCESFTKKKN